MLECSVTSVNRLIATPPTLELVFSDTVLNTLSGSSSQVFRLDRVQTLSGVYRCNAEVTIIGLNVTVNGTGDNHLTIPGISLYFLMLLCCYEKIFIKNIFSIKDHKGYLIKIGTERIL